MDLDEKLRKGFDIFDANGDGRITIGELGNAIRAQGKNPTEAQLRELMAKADKDGSGWISFPEFCDMMKAPMQDASDRDAIVAAFKVFDLDKNGTIDRAELKRVMTSMGEPLTSDEAEMMLNQADKDRDGVINYTEFVDMYLTTSG